MVPGGMELPPALSTGRSANFTTIGRTLGYYPGPMPERAALITLLIVDRPLCLECIVIRSGIDRLGVETYLDRVKEHLIVFHEDSDRCRACGIVGKVYALDRIPL